ncbi:TPA: plasmid stabilization protein, partial [Escherichia coli]|nr:plasmid stabilization protein [Escherichia coli]
QVRAKVAAARADKRPGMSSAQLRLQLQGRYQELRNEL